ncbi:MAG: hypothetical protein NTZ05_16995, partial [Chloroflexi bacterium]|nr:hypothetical protein [Chloroflexota bacterium]
VSAAEPGRVVAWLKGSALPYGQGITYYPLGEIVKGAFGIRESDSLDIVRGRLVDGMRDLIHRAVAAGGSAVHGSVEDEALEVAHRLGYAIGVNFPGSRIANINPANVKDEMYWAWRLFFLRNAELGPTVVIIEDIHWADDLVHLPEPSRTDGTFPELGAVPHRHAAALGAAEHRRVGERGELSAAPE